MNKELNTDSLQTWLGLFEALVIATIDYVMHLTGDNLDWQSGTFWAGLALALSRGIKGYYSAGVSRNKPPASPSSSGAPPIAAIALCLLGLSGCSTTKGTMFDGTVCTFATSDSTAKLAQTIVQSYAPGLDRAKAEQYLNTAHLGATALCEMARSRQGASNTKE